MRRTTGLAAMTAILFAGTAQAQTPLAGPPAAGHSRVLVIGVDGTRWDLLRQAMAAGRAPNLARLSREGVAGPTLLPYTPPTGLTISEVGWSTIASGVGPAKHGVNGLKLNMDPGQATKNGYSDFLTRAESVRPAASTFLVSDWDNIGRAKNGGPIFGTAIDTRHTVTAVDTVDSWNRGDAEVTEVAARYLRRGDPDAGFVYLGQVDEVAHLVGSATPAYLDAIELADKRIGVLLDLIRSRRTYGLERWTVIVTTDHGQQDFNYPSIVSHGGASELERTSFVFAAGPGIPSSGTPIPGVVDIAPTVVHQLGLKVNPAWNLDGRSFVTTGPPPPRPAARVRVRSRRPALELAVEAAKGAPALSAVRLRLPRGLALRRGARARVNGRRTGRRRVRVARHALAITLPAGARTLQVRVPLRRLPRRLPRSLPASVTEAGDVALERRIAVARRR